ncbi:mitochondrial ribonuclease P catalytic subunit-like isoform X2 [Paramacrobiotus metropolitanus]|nr:mitochondrial ribonuclease P catalytic subunit-like isoform X2 [Paramacrobiotus metropolitanus]
MSLATSYKYQKLGNSIRDYFLKTNTPMPIVIAAKYVQLCGRLEGPEREEKVLQAYAELKKLSRLGIFDATTAQTVIDALYRTSQWKECIRLREIIQVLDAVGPTVNGKIVAGAFLHDDPDTAGEFLRVIQTAKQALIPVALIAWYDYACRIGQVEVMKMLEHTRNAEWFIPLEVANKLKARMESQADEDGYRWRGRFTTISMKGECKACGAYLEPITITKEEFLKLRDNFFRLVVETSDVFLRSNPKEVAEFREFVEINAPFDLVIDGLNAAYFQHEAQRVTSRKLAERLRMVVEYVTTRNVGPKKVLVLGRKHMRSWPIDEMRRISRAAKLFYAENISQDDPFLLYAALFSGPQCDFMSSDLMRDHRFKLESKENQDALQKVFLKWQRTHQLQILKVFPDGTVKLKPPMRFDTVAQWTKDSMHIPYESGVPRGLHEIPTNWLCLTKGSADTTRI